MKGGQDETFHPEPITKKNERRRLIMEKALTFSTEKKNLIWRRFVDPQGGTKEECDQFIEICETFGLNPLLGDIVFQKFGERVNFITTRDGLLRVATRQPGYVGAPNANVVREGDIFKFKPSEGEVYHEFGTKRGKILGAYAVMKHKEHNPVAVFVDFDEYYNANSGLKNSRSGKPNVWDTMPSAMIVKVAEVFVLRRQFPLGGLYTREEMGIDEMDQDSQNLPVQPVSNNPKPEQISQEQDNKQEQQQQGKKQEKNFITKEQADELNAIINKIAEARNVEPTAVTNALGKSIIELETNEFDSVKEKLAKWLKIAEQQQQTKEQPKQDNPENIFTLIKKETGKAPNGAEFIKLFVKEMEQPIFARTTKAVEDAKKLNEEDGFTADIQEENGFVFLVSITEIINNTKNAKSA